MKKDNEQVAQPQKLLKKWLLPKLMIVIAVIVIAIMAVIGWRNLFFSESKTTKIGFEDIGELATQSVSCTEVNTIEASRDFYGITIPFTQSKYIYSYDVEIKAGFNFADIEWSEHNKVIEVRLPAVEITSSTVDLESFKIYHESESIFRQISMDENNEALKTLQQRAEEDAVANGLFENARRNAEKILTAFFGNEYDLKEYQIKFVDQ